MNETDHITLPRSVVEQALKALEYYYSLGDSFPTPVFHAIGYIRAALPAARPDVYCITAPDGECVSTDPRCMHNLPPKYQTEPEPAAWQDTTKPTELVSAEEWEYIDPMWHWMYRPLYTFPPDQTTEIERAVAAEREACAKLVEPDDEHRRYASHYIGGDEGVELLDNCAAAIRARGDK